MNAFADHFSGHAAAYLAYRPRYPGALFDWLAAQAPGRDLALDCGTGSGQAATALGDRFARVIATDASEAQLANAVAHPRVEYRVAPAESPGVERGSVDLVTVAQAFHWFDAPRFFAAAHDALRGDGLLAFWAYAGTSVASPTDEIVHDFRMNTVGIDWPSERGLVDDSYRQIVVPPSFAEFASPFTELTADWTLDEYIGYIGTWSAVQRHIKRTGVDPVPALRSALVPGWPAGERRVVRWPLTVRVARRVAAAT
jgi:SAM-dependent methyltransferase